MVKLLAPRRHVDGSVEKGSRLHLGTVDDLQPCKPGLASLVRLDDHPSSPSSPPSPTDAQRRDDPPSPSHGLPNTAAHRLVSSRLVSSIHGCMTSKKSSHAQTATDEAVPIYGIPARLRPS